MSKSSRRLSELRKGRSEVENHYIDELVAGRLDRREFLRRGAVAGMSASVMGAILSACGSSSKSPTTTSSAKPVQGGTISLATAGPATDVNPFLVADSGGLCMLAQTGEFLTFDNNLTNQLEPMLATSWSHNGDGTVWTFKLRPNVKFHNGQPMTSADVVYTMQQLSDPKNPSNALSAFGGVLLPSGVKAVDPMTVEFTLVAANGNFPYIVSTDNYNAIIVPKGTDISKWQDTFIGTGPFKFKSYTTNVGASFVANPDYWGPKPYLDGTSFKFYTSQPPQVLALEGGDVDVLCTFVPGGAEGILTNPTYTLINFESSQHRELSMRCDQAPFNDPRVRQAVALSLNRPAIVHALLAGKGSVANDNPFAPKFKSTDTSVPQRVQDISKAKQLLAAAGHSSITATLAADIYEEIPQLAQIVKQAASAIGVNINLKVESQSAYYGKATFGNSDWLDSEMSLVNYGDRGVPNTFLDAPYTTKGSWNAAHFHNPQYDALEKQYIAAVDLQTQKTIAGKIETLLLEQTPVIIPYWINGLTATKSSVHGVVPNALGAVFLGRTFKA